jgi:hypothetical protein
MADNETANALPDAVPESDTGLGEPGVTGLEAQVAQFAVMMNQLLTTRAPAARSYPPIPPPESAAGAEIDPRAADAAQQPAYQAMSYPFIQQAKLEGYLRGAVFEDAETSSPEFLGLVKVSRESALRQAGRHIVFKDSEEEEDEEADRGVGAQAELPLGYQGGRRESSWRASALARKCGTSGYCAKGR